MHPYIIQTYIQTFIHTYISAPPHTGTHPPHIFGTTCFRDNIEDEWLIVHLLFAVSKQCGDDLVISVTDSDGQFLLIEAAHHLPKWLKPETSTNRVSC